MKVKSLLKSNKFSRFGINQIRKLQLTIIPVMVLNVQFNIKKFLRVLRLYRNSRYEKLRGLKSKHKGERCFIVCTGPSLLVEDLEKLKNEVTFSMNSICLALNETDWRPTYYGIQDSGVFTKLENYIERFDVGCQLFADTISVKKNGPENLFIFPLHLFNHNFAHRKYKTKFSADAFAVVYDGYSITYSLIQLAVYMGFKEIYLLGADCNYSSNMKHHFKDYEHVDPSFLLAGDKMVCAYKEAKKYADHNNIKIYNATRGGMLELFERVDLDEVLAEKSQESLVF